MSDYTPTTAEMTEWIAMADGASGHGGESLARFKRWLSTVVQQSKADALEEFADTLGVNAGDEDSDEWRGYRNGQRQALRMATFAAAAIRATGGSDE